MRSLLPHHLCAIIGSICNCLSKFEIRRKRDEGTFLCVGERPCLRYPPSHHLLVMCWIVVLPWNTVLCCPSIGSMPARNLCAWVDWTRLSTGGMLVVRSIEVKTTTLPKWWDWKNERHFYNNMYYLECEYRKYIATLMKA